MPRLDSRSVTTRETILAAAERMFAEHGIHLVSNRQISEAAGQGNNAAVGYHFGSRESLLRAIVENHNPPIERLRAEYVARVRPDDLRSWIDCMVRPTMDHLDQLGSPTWFARFTLQLMADPTGHAILAEQSARDATLREVLINLKRRLPDLPPAVRAERADIMRNAILQTSADRERALADNESTPRSSWSGAATGLVDALYGLWTAPVTPTRRSRDR